VTDVHRFNLPASKERPRFSARSEQTPLLDSDISRPDRSFFLVDEADELTPKAPMPRMKCSPPPPCSVAPRRQTADPLSLHVPALVECREQQTISIQKVVHGRTRHTAGNPKSDEWAMIGHRPLILMDQLRTVPGTRLLNTIYCGATMSTVVRPSVPRGCALPVCDSQIGKRTLNYRYRGSYVCRRFTAVSSGSPTLNCPPAHPSTRVRRTARRFRSAMRLDVDLRLLVRPSVVRG
jgi:hypothetical protein